MFKLMFTFLMTVSAWSDDVPPRNLAGNVACLRAIQFASNGNVGRVNLLSNHEKDKPPQAVGMKGIRDGKHGIYIYTGNAAKFFPYPDAKPHYDTTTNTFHRMKIEINGKPYLVEESSAQTKIKSSIREPLYPDIYVSSLSNDKKYNSTFQDVSGRDVLNDDTANLLADEVRKRTEAIMPELKEHLMYAKNPGVDGKIASNDYVENFLGSYSRGLQICQDNMILSHKAAEDLREIKKMNQWNTTLYQSLHPDGNRAR